MHNRRELRKIVATNEADGGFAVVDIDTLWRDDQGRDNHWRGRVCKVYTRMPGGDWKLMPDDVARAVIDLLTSDVRSLVSRVEMRPSKPRK